MKYKKNYGCKAICILCVISSLLLMTGCESKEEKQHEKQMAESAVQYIEQKYGFTPEVLEYHSDYQQQIYGAKYYPQVLIEMVHDEQEFLVYMDGSEGRDSWQHERLCKALQAEIDQKIPGIQTITLDGYQFFESNRYRDFTDCLCGEYFDGNNLFDVLEDCQGCFHAYYVNGDFSDESRFAWLTERDVRGLFVSMRSEEELEQMRAVHTAPAYVAQFYAENAIYVDSYRDMRGDYAKFDLKQYGDLYYLTYNEEKQPNNDSISIREGEFPKRFELRDIVGSEFYVASKAYDVSFSEKSYAVFFYPIAELDGDEFSSRNTFLLMRWTDAEGEAGSNYRQVSWTGDYAVSSSWYNPYDDNICIISRHDAEN